MDGERMMSAEDTPSPAARKADGGDRVDTEGVEGGRVDDAGFGQAEQLARQAAHVRFVGGP